MSTPFFEVLCLLKVHLLPRFAERYLDEIGREDVQRMHIDRRMQGAAPGSANRLLILMRYMFNLAKKWEIPGAESNPTEGIPLMAVNNMKERYLSIEEANALYEAVCRSENRMLQFIVPMLLFTGARKREVLDAQWKDFDVDRKLWRIPLSKSGKARFVPLSDGALHVLKQVPRENHSAWVFSNPKTGLPFVTIFTSWNTARTSVGLGDVRMHDLRHSFASLLINSGRSLYEVQKLLGHTQVQTTQRYAHLAPQTLLQASNEATKALHFILR
jgi:integrase